MEEEESTSALRKRRRRRDEKYTDGRGSESPLYEVVCPAVYLIRVFGLAPYEYPKDNRPPLLRPSNVNCIFSLFWILFSSYVVARTMMRFNGLDRDKPILGVTENGKLILNYIVSVADIALNIANRKQFVHVWNDIEDFDETHGLGNPPKNGNGRFGPILRKTRFWVWTVLVLYVIGWTSVNQLGMHAFNEPYLQNIGYMLTYIGTSVGVMKFCGLIFLLGQRFKWLNEQMRKQRAVNGTEFDLVEANVVVKKIESSYDRLMRTSEKLNDVYTWSIFLFLFNLFCHAVCNMYFFTIWTIVDPSYLKNPKVVFCLGSWLIIYLVQLLLLHVSCHFTSLEANRMANVLLDWRRHADRQSKQNNFSSTLHFLNRRLNFSAAGCFNVNLPLLTSCFGHMTTYLIILLQLPTGNDS